MKIPAFCLLSFYLIYFTLSAQPSLLPDITLLTLEGEKITASEIKSEGRPMLVAYWNLSNKECCNQLESLLNIRDEHMEDYQVKIVGIFVANSGLWAGLKPLLNGKAWDIDVYIDINSELVRAMCIPQLPFTMLYDPDMKLVCSSIGYCANMEDNLCKKIRACLSDKH